MKVSVVSSIRPGTLHRSDRTPEDGPREAGNQVLYAGAVTLSVESEGKNTFSFYAILPVPTISEWACPADLCSDLSDVAIASETVRVRVSNWSVVHVVLSCHPGQVAGQLHVDGGVL